MCTDHWMRDNWRSACIMLWSCVEFHKYTTLFTISGTEKKQNEKKKRKANKPQSNDKKSCNQFAQLGAGGEHGPGEGK